MTTDKLRAIVAAMTPGPWGDGEDRTEHGVSYGPTGPDGRYLLAGHDEAQDGDDATGIAALRNVAPELLAVAEAAAGWRRAMNGGGPTGLAESCLCAALDALYARIAALPDGGERG